MEKHINKIKILEEKTTDLKTKKFMRGLLAFYKKTGTLTHKQIQALDKTWRNTNLT